MEGDPLLEDFAHFLGIVSQLCLLMFGHSPQSHSSPLEELSEALQAYRLSNKMRFAITAFCQSALSPKKSFLLAEVLSTLANQKLGSSLVLFLENNGLCGALGFGCMRVAFKFGFYNNLYLVISLELVKRNVLSVRKQKQLHTTLYTHHQMFLVHFVNLSLHTASIPNLLMLVPRFTWLNESAHPNPTH